MDYKHLISVGDGRRIGRVYMFFWFKAPRLLRNWTKLKRWLMEHRPGYWRSIAEFYLHEIQRLQKVNRDSQMSLERQRHIIESLQVDVNRLRDEPGSEE